MPDDTSPLTLEQLARELASCLVLTRPLVCVDLEATGVRLGRDRIVSMSSE